MLNASTRKQITTACVGQEEGAGAETAGMAISGLSWSTSWGEDTSLKTKTVHINPGSDPFRQFTPTRSIYAGELNCLFSVVHY